MNYMYCHGDQIQYDFFGRRKFLNVKGMRWELERMSDHKNMTLKLSHSKNYQLELRTTAKFWCVNFHHKS